MFRRVVVLVQVDPDAVVVGQLARLAQVLDELLHVLHGLFVSFAAHLLEVQRDEGGPAGGHVRQELLDPDVEQAGGLAVDGEDKRGFLN